MIMAVIREKVQIMFFVTYVKTKDSKLYLFRRLRLKANGLKKEGNSIRSLKKIAAEPRMKTCKRKDDSRNDHTFKSVFQAFLT